MSSRSERTIVEALGFPDSDDSFALDFTATEVSGVLDTNCTYRFAATEDCYVKLTAPGAGGDVDSDDMILFGGIPEIFQTTSDRNQICVIQTTVAGVLHCTRMKGPGR